MHLTLENMREGYVELGKAILTNGHASAPRGEGTVEVVGASFTLLDPTDALPFGTGRGVVSALGVVEALQLIGGFSNPKRLIEVAPHFANFLDESGELHGAYGPRLAGQIPQAIEHLTGDPDTRRAHVSIWQPTLDNRPGLHDYPCTISLQWLLRRGRLHAVTHMRSNDFWLGVPYDVFQFTRVQLTIASILGVEPGEYHHHASSLHVYAKHFDKVADLKADGAPHDGVGGIAASSWEQAALRARMLHSCAAPTDETSDERWMRRVLAGRLGVA